MTSFVHLCLLHSVTTGCVCNSAYWLCAKLAVATVHVATTIYYEFCPSIVITTMPPCCYHSTLEVFMGINYNASRPYLSFEVNHNVHIINCLCTSTVVTYIYVWTEHPVWLIIYQCDKDLLP